jgi:hypothetical protein
MTGSPCQQLRMLPPCERWVWQQGFRLHLCSCETACSRWAAAQAPRVTALPRLGRNCGLLVGWAFKQGWGIRQVLEGVHVDKGISCPQCTVRHHSRAQPTDLSCEAVARHMSSQHVPPGAIISPWHSLNCHHSCFEATYTPALTHLPVELPGSVCAVMTTPSCRSAHVSAEGLC